MLITTLHYALHLNQGPSRDTKSGLFITDETCFTLHLHGTYNVCTACTAITHDTTTHWPPPPLARQGTTADGRQQRAFLLARSHSTDPLLLSPPAARQLRTALHPAPPRSSPPGRSGRGEEGRLSHGAGGALGRPAPQPVLGEAVALRGRREIRGSDASFNIYVQNYSVQHYKVQSMHRQASGGKYMEL